jgi:carboxypeptidase Taq
LLEQAQTIPCGSASSWDLSDDAQEQLCNALLEEWGYSNERCSRARSPHPFSSTLGPNDFRITTRVVPGQPLSAFLATAHEWGHSLYEQGLPRRGDHWFPWPLGEATSMGVHESQSLFYENRLGRSAALAKRWHPRFMAALSRDVWGDDQAFWRDLNPIRAGLTRVEADEVSYGLHVLLRYELELALVEGGMPVAELPEAWNRGMQELLGVTPSNDAEGCLQDVHWSDVGFKRLGQDFPGAALAPGGIPLHRRELLGLLQAQVDQLLKGWRKRVEAVGALRLLPKGVPLRLGLGQLPHQGRV